MAETEEQWTLRLLDMVSGNAARMAASLGGLDAAQNQAASSAAVLEKAQKAAGGALRGADGKFLKNGSPEYIKATAEKSTSAAGAPAALGASADPFVAANAGADKFISKRTAVKDVLSGSLASSVAAARDIGGPIGMIAGQIQGVAGSIGRIGPGATAALYAVKALVYAITAGVAALIAMGAAAIHITSLRAQLTTTFAALGGGAAGGAKTLAIVDKLGQSLPFATDKIAQWATGLQKAGLQGRALEQAIKAVGAATALMGESGGAAVQDFISKLALGGPAAMQLIATIKLGGPEARSQLAEMGLRVEDLAAALGMTTAQFKVAKLSAKQMAEVVEKALARKAAGPLADLMLGFPSILAKAKEGFLSLFDKLGPAIRPFMAAVKSLFGEFSKGGAALAFLKPIVTSVMTTAFAWATRAVTAIHGIVTALTSASKAGGFFSDAVTTMKAGWAVLKGVWATLSGVLAPIIGLLRTIFSNALVLKGIKAIFTAIVAIIVILVVIVATVGAVFATVFGVITSIIGAVVGTIVWLVGMAEEGFGVIGGLFSGLGDQAMAAGQEIINGLMGFDFSAFVSKMAGMAQAGLDAFTDIFGIKSPSTVMLKHGEDNIAGAAATGVDAGAEKVDASMEGLGGGPKGGGKGGRGGGRGKIAETIIFQYGGPAEDAPSFFEQAQEWLENLAHEAPSPGPT